MSFLISLGVLIVGFVLLMFGMGKAEGRNKGEGERWEFLLPGHLLFWPSLVMVVFFGILWPAQYFSSLVNVQALEAFVETRCVYVQAIDHAEAVIIQGAETVDGSLVDLTYQQQAQKYAEMVLELRDKTLWYNTTLERVDALRDAPLIGGFRVGAAHLEPITDAFGGCP